MCIKSRLLAVWFATDLIMAAYNKSGEKEVTSDTFGFKCVRVKRFIIVVVRLKYSLLSFKCTLHGRSLRVQLKIK